MNLLLLALIVSGVPLLPVVPITPASFAVVNPHSIALPPSGFELTWNAPVDTNAVSVSVFETQDLRKDWNFVTNVLVTITNVLVPNQYPQEFFKIVSVNNANLDSDGIVEQLNN